MTKEEEKYLFCLTSLSGLGLPFVQRFFERYKSIDKACSLSETDIKKAEWMKPREKNYFAKAYKQEGWQHEWEQLAKNHISFYSYFHESYPERLKHIDSPPKRETAGCIKTFCGGCRGEKLYAVRTGYGTDV